MAMQIVANNLQLATSKVRTALEAYGKPVSGINPDTDKTQITVNLAACPKEFLQELLTTALTEGQRRTVAALVGDRKDILDVTVSNHRELFKVLKALDVPGEPTVEIQVGTRWYPAPVSRLDLQAPSQFGPGACSLTVEYRVCDQLGAVSAAWGTWSFKDSADNQVSKTVRQLLEEEGLRISSPESVDRIREKMDRADRTRKQVGRVMAVKAAVLEPNQYLWRQSLGAVPLGTESAPRQLIVEPELEIANGHSYYRHDSNRNSWALPFVRAFSLDLKTYVYADVDDLGEHAFDSNALSKLVLPHDIDRILRKIFDTPTESLFGDMYKGRHGGMVILANGPQGCGKTMTAEVFAEHTRRPLYVLEMGELGTDLKDVEKSLQLIFARAARWNAVLLFDEADVFLSKRDDSSLERNAIVGVFLRLLDRHEGLFFLTSNRAGAIDPAFKSRITLALQYKALDREAREKVWRNMLQAAGVPFKGDLHRIVEKGLDGRQIRNQVKLLKTIYGGCEVTEDQVLQTMEFAIEAGA